MNKSQIEDIYYKLFDEETVKLRFSSFSKFATFRTKLYRLKSTKDDERDIISGFTYSIPVVNINIHYVPGSEAIIAVIKFKEKLVTPVDFVEFDEVTQTWIEATQHE